MTRKRAALSTGLLLLVFGALALPLSPACSGSTSSAPAQAPVLPVLSASTGPSAAPASSPPYNLEKAVPLLARAELQPAMTALENDQPRAALQIVQKAFAAADPDARERRRWQYLLAQLSEQAGDLATARQAYEEAAAQPWALSGYARLGLGRIKLASGDAAGAIAALESITAQPPLAPKVDALMADAALKAGDIELALARYRAFLAVEPSPQGWQAIALAYGRTSVQRAEALVQVAGAQSKVDLPMLPPALHWLGRLRGEAEAEQTELGQLEERALRLLPAEQRTAASRIPNEDRLARVNGLLEQRRNEEAEAEAVALLEALAEQPFSPLACEARVARARALSGLRQWGKGVDLLGDVLTRCADGELRARAAYLGGKSAFSDKRYSAAIRMFGEVERNPARKTLGDDARLYAALAHLELGDRAQFTELLSRMPDDYPDGDMSREGAFRLALSQLEKREFAVAIPLLEKAALLPEPVRHGEQLGREQYFLARAQLALGEQVAGLRALEALIEGRPLSYYMLHAFTRLSSVDATRAQSAIARGRARAESEPFVFEHSVDMTDPRLERALELLQVGDVQSASEEIEVLGSGATASTPGLLWGVAVLYQQLGAARFCHRLATDLRAHWLTRWPSGPWLSAWQLAFPRPYASNVARAAQRNGLDAALVYAIMREESAFDPKAISKANALGLMQLLGSTARSYQAKVGLPAHDQALLTPQVNIAYGSYVLSAFAAKFPENRLLAIPGYNAGPSRPKRWLKELPSTEFDLWVELIPYRETRDYTKRVLASRAAYAYLYGDADPDALSLPLQVE